MAFIPRTKFSAPPAPAMSDVDYAALRNLVNHAGLYVVLDILHRHAVDMEIQVYTAPADLADNALTLRQVEQARAAWQMLDRVQVEIGKAVREREARDAEIREHAAHDGHDGNEEILSP